jgi:hypothetical protein
VEIGMKSGGSGEESEVWSSSAARGLRLWSLWGRCCKSFKAS